MLSAPNRVENQRFVNDEFGIVELGQIVATPFPTLTQTNTDDGDKRVYNGFPY